MLDCRALQSPEDGKHAKINVIGESLKFVEKTPQYPRGKEKIMCGQGK
jgi:hypothetical protein